MRNFASVFLINVIAISAVCLTGSVALTDCTPGERAVTKTAFDVASEACRFAYGKAPNELPFGLTAEQFCSQAKNVQPFVDSILSAQRSQAVTFGTRHEADAGAE